MTAAIPMSDRKTFSTADLVRIARDSRLPIREQQAAFTILVESFEEMAYTTALRSCHDADAARDICQEAFLIAWRTLSTLRDPDAFGGWLKRLVRTQCSRASRKRRATVDVSAVADESDFVSGSRDAIEELTRRESYRMLQRAIDELPPSERRAIVLFYYLGEPLRGLARAMQISPASAGKRVHLARQRLRGRLPRSLAEAFLLTAPSRSFTRRVQADVFKEFEGEYRFPSRPDEPVVVRREGAALVSYAAGQRNVLASRKTDVFAPTEFDGEGRFRRDKKGRISAFVYYEFGRRLGVASKVRSKGRSANPESLES